jgi:predicted 3-demethylubiquinone-9 3-methyltransferase (glyoxalase superfamily)
MTNSIYPCLWFNNCAAEATDFYRGIFKNSKTLAQNPFVTKFELEGLTVMGLNGGPIFKINPSISFFVFCKSDEEVEEYYHALVQDGSVLMELGTYPWSEKYAWIKDKYDMTWQLMKSELPEGAQKIMPCMLFVGEQFGRAKQAIELYAEIFKNSEVRSMEMYGPDEPFGIDKVKFSNFLLHGKEFAAMDGPGNHEFKFNEGVSFVIE